MSSATSVSTPVSTPVSTESAAPAPAGAPLPNGGFIINPIADRVLLIFSPLIALGLGAMISGSRFSHDEVTFMGEEGTISSLFIGTFIMAHLFIVFFRSHGNPEIFRLHRFRFIGVPILLFAAMSLSTWAAVIVAVIATWWDVYHSALQTFGIGRIYDMRAGNGPMVGRRLDYLVNVLLYAGPIMAGATLMLHIEDFDEFEKVGSVFFTAIPAYTMERQGLLRGFILMVGLPFLAFYLYRYWKYHREGYRVSHQKVALLASTGFCSIYAWGYNSFGEAFFIMNFFHALQYFALVWWSEKKHMQSLFGLSKFKWGRAATFVLFLAIAFSYGLWAETSEMTNDLVFNAVLVVSIMHFWYDGFIWSVRKKQV